MKNALILHGTNSNSQDNWFQYLKKELEKRGYQVWIPDLPRANKPNVARYNSFLFNNKEWNFNQNSILIGHSSGAVAILGILQHLPKNSRVNTCVLVGAFKNDLGWKSLNELFLESFDFDYIKTKANKFIFIHSDNDPYCPLEHAKYLSQKLAGKLIIKKGQGHFNLEISSKYKQFPFLLNLISKI